MSGGKSLNTHRSGICLLVRLLGSLYCTPRAGICLVEKWLGSLSYMSRAVICLVRRERSLSYTHGGLIFLVLKRVGSFSYTPRVSSFVGRGIMSYTPRHRICLGIVGSFSSTFRNGICLVARRVSPTSPVLQSVRSFVGWGVSLIRPVLESISVCSFGR